MSQPNELVTVYVAQGRLAAEVVRGLLESEHIPAMLAYESIGQIYGLTMDGLGQVQVKVPEPFAEQARAIIQDSSVE